MAAFILRRLALSVVVLLAIVTASFFMQRLAPGGPFSDERDLPEETRRRQRAEWALDRPLYEQYGTYVLGLCSLPPDLKRSMKQSDHTVVELLAPRLAVSLSLAGVVFVLSLVIGIPLGVIAAVKRDTWADRLVMVAAVIGATVPSFVIGPLLKWVFALELGWLPESRWVSPASVVLPAFALSLVYIATIARLVRAGLVEQLGQDFIRTARAKGLPERVIVVRHALRGALLPVVSWLGPALASLATGSVVIERAFSIPGAGSLFVDAAFNRDYTVVMGTVIVYSSLLVVLNLAVDMLLPVLDPRLRGAR